MRRQVKLFHAFLFVGAAFASALLSATEVPAVQKFHNNYPFDQFSKFSPQAGKPVEVTAGKLVRAIEEYEIAVKQKLAMKLETTRIEDGLRFVLRWDQYSFSDHVIEVKLKPENRACFVKSDVYRCFLLSSFRKVTMPHRSIEDQQFTDTQEDYFLERQVDGTLRVLASCYDDRCSGVDWE